jgi:hypothetical protein
MPKVFIHLFIPSSYHWRDAQWVPFLDEHCAGDNPALPNRHSLHCLWLPPFHTVTLLSIIMNALECPILQAYQFSRWHSNNGTPDGHGPNFQLCHSILPNFAHTLCWNIFTAGNQGKSLVGHTGRIGWILGIIYNGRVSKFTFPLDRIMPVLKTSKMFCPTPL